MPKDILPIIFLLCGLILNTYAANTTADGDGNVDDGGPGELTDYDIALRLILNTYAANTTTDGDGNVDDGGPGELTDYDIALRKTDIGLNITQLNSSINNPHNVTTPHEVPQWRAVLDLIATILSVTNTINMILAMGAATSWREVWQHSKKPMRAIIGMVGQFILLPALGVGLSLVFSLSVYEAIGVLMVSCSPGGTASNFFNYWVDGDLALSIVMTTWSSALSVGTLPLNVWIYSRIWIDDESNILIPYETIMIGLMFVVIPTIIGMVVRSYKEKAADVIVKVCSFLGWLGFVIAVTIWVVLYWDVFFNANSFLWLAALLLPLSGFCIAYGFSLLVRQNHVIARTIGIETGCQNMAVAMNIILLSFPDPKIKSAMLVYPILFGVTLYVQVFIFIACYQLYKHCHQHHQFAVTRDDNGKPINVKTTIN